MRIFSYILAGLLLMACLSSCRNQKELQYLQNMPDSSFVAKIPFEELKIQKGDLLSIVIYSDNAEASRDFNQGPVSLPSTGGMSVSGSNGNPTYLVDEDGNIRMYSIGMLHAEGLTRKELSALISKTILEKDLLKNPYAEVRFQNLKVTILGEVSRPSVYSLPADKVNIFDALGMAGDITQFGRRDNVLVIREMNGKRQSVRLDLSKPDVYNSEFFYLQQNDLVMVSASKSKVSASEQNTLRNITIATSVLSTIAIFLNVFRR